ncbi:psbP-like protein 1, chloroplastic [Lycium ferocissimum]|uniref:psbP-like protein 1, chloroplastic n=1 Tax=Lycium ferocissimum TaxID=112874 RepID=UPI0028160403|nr:psbP-like protein 1, chloroplastic [Lycium ferocissimum]XP_059303739.1 psbP-like protein 1, chloroplastic [Lycium ferocissimum]XP_059303740.1 psbP-like protein 1, chloroplastic [Lycium ferocissimum]
MVSVQKFTTPYHAYLPNAASQMDVMHQVGWFRKNGHNRRGPGCVIRSENVTEISISSSQDRLGRRQFLAIGPTIVPLLLMTSQTPISFAAENKKGFLPVTDKKDGYSFLYPFGWQEVVVEGEDKVFKDVIEPLESASVNLVPSSKEDIRDFGSPQQVAEILIKKFLASPSQKTKLIDAAERDIDGRAYYTFEFTAQAPNYTRHALTAVCIGNGKFYTLTTGANERRWEKMKDRLHAVVDSFQIFNV